MSVITYGGTALSLCLNLAFFSPVYVLVKFRFDIYTHSCSSNSGAWRKQHQGNDFNPQEMHFMVKCTLCGYSRRINGNVQLPG